MDEGKTYVPWTPTIAGKEIYVADFIPVKDNVKTSKNIVIWPIDKHKTTPAIIIYKNHSGVRTDLIRESDYQKNFYLHGRVYLVLRTIEDDLCLFTLNRSDHLVRIICKLSPYEESGYKCPIVINSQIPGIIFANIKTYRGDSKTVISFDNGKHFEPIKLNLQPSESSKKDCYVELILECKEDLITNFYPEKWVVTFNGMYHCGVSSNHHLFISFNGGRSWRIFHAFSEGFSVLNHGGLILGRQFPEDKLWYSYDEGNNFYDVLNDDVFKIIPLESKNHLVISAINLNEDNNMYSIFNYNFSNIISAFCLTVDRTCQRDDYESWYVPRYYENCFYGKEVSYLKKKPFAMCFDNRTEVLPNIKPCQCVREGFQWYKNLVIIV
ncbi:hypothetical protein RF11_16398 [Thelohanellus kitauei]|uniref:Vacuolar protein sorting/targeting protein 10 n=1 Tax=Thelohanellus kitauei TaxID=669202 RepID=A0A0C2J3F8_THEKT|nr:hypothetical protein RF11_16398 [Thelohanellus kitauei]